MPRLSSEHEQRKDGEKPKQLVGVGRVLENLTEKERLLRVPEPDARESGRLIRCVVLNHRLRGAYTQHTAAVEQAPAGVEAQWLSALIHPARNLCRVRRRKLSALRSARRRSPANAAGGIRHLAFSPTAVACQTG